MLTNNKIIPFLCSAVLLNTASLMAMNMPSKIEKAELLLKDTIKNLYGLPPKNFALIDPQGKNRELYNKRKEQRAWLYHKMGHNPSKDINKLTYEDLLALTTLIPDAKESTQRSVIERYLSLYIARRTVWWYILTEDCLYDIRDKKIRMQGDQKQ